MSGISKKEKQFRKKVKKKLRPTLKKIEVPFLPVLKPIRRLRSFIKGIQILGTIGKVLISLTNVGLSAYEFYNNVVKDLLEKQKSMTS